MGKCLIGGNCFNGKCICEKGFSGDFCEDKEGELSLTWLWALVIIEALADVGYACYKYKDNIKNFIDRDKSWIALLQKEEIIFCPSKKMITIQIIL